MFSSTNLRNPELKPIGPITYVPGRRPDDPPCTCIECTQQYRKTDEQLTLIHVYKGSVDNEQAAAACAKMVQSINDDRAFLQRELTSRGSGIAKRWKKRTLKSREGLLKSIDPDMYDRKWHEAHISYEARYDNWLIEARKHQNIHLLPYMSLENLKEEPSRLIKLLQLRTKYSPAELAAADNRRLSFGWTTGVLDTTFNNSAIVMHGAHYGSLVPWHGDEVHRGDTIGFPRGQLILKAQSRLLSVLRGIVEVIVDGLPEDEEPKNSTSPTVTSLPSIGAGSVYVDEAFSSCPTFDLEKLADISNSRLRSAKDHLSYLKTDPAYMQRYVQLIQKSGYSKLPKEITFAMTTEDLNYETWTIRHWVWISDEISLLKQIRLECMDQINCGETVPPKYRHKLASFEALILHLLDIQSRHIQCGLPYRPGFQHLYDFESSIVAGRAHLSHSYKGRSDDPVQQTIVNAEAFKKDPLHWCISSLTTHPDAPGVWDKFRLLEFLDQHLSNASTEERSRLDETLSRKISDLAAFNELLTLVRSHRPRAVQRDMAELRTLDQGWAWRFMARTIPNSEYDYNGHQIISERTLQEIPLAYADLGKLLNAFMEKEPPKDVTGRGWLIKDIAQRKALRCFWDRFRQSHQKLLKDAGIDSSDMSDDLKLISADSDPEILAALQAERKERLAINSSFPPVKEIRPVPRSLIKTTNAQQEKHSQGLVKPVRAPTTHNTRPSKKKGELVTNGEVQSEWGATPIAAKPTGETKVKPKTRGQKSIVDQELAALNITSAVDNQKPSEKVPVKKSAFEVLSSLFPRQGGSKSILWDKFVDSMAKVGFMSRRSGGSAVSFEPILGSKWYGQGSIVFHRPHPDSTIDPVMLNSFGKRIKKWFGWGNETFELGN